MKFKFLLLVVLFLAACSTTNKNITQNHFNRNVANTKISDWGISGISSGAMMSAQLAIAHSKDIDHVGIFSGSIYGCSQGKAQTALGLCMAQTDKIDEKKSLDYLKQKNVPEDIDNLENIKKQKIFLFHGKLDKVVKFDVLAKNEVFYKNLKAQTKTQSLDRLGHSFATSNPTGSSCESSISPYINNCQYDSIYEFFKFLYPQKTASSSSPDHSRLYYWDAETFTSKEKLSLASMSKDIYVYIPKSCENNTCSAHIALHGCHQAPEFVNKDFIEKAGYLEAAEKFNTVVIFPSVLKSTLNPYGCWDWWGYSDSKNFDTKKAPQIEILYSLMKQL